MSKERLHVWIESKIKDFIDEEALDNNVTRSEMVRVILSRYHRSFGSKNNISKKYRKTNNHYKCKSLNVFFTSDSYNRMIEHCRRTGETRSSFVRRACNELLKAENVR